MILIIIIILLLESFFYISVKWWFFTGISETASHFKSPGLFSAFWPISLLLKFRESPPVSLFPIPCTNPLETKSRTQIIIGNRVTFMFHSFFNPLARSRYLSFFSFTFRVYSMVSRDSKVHNFSSSLFFVVFL